MSVRPSAIAGTWYPADPGTLRQDVERMLAAPEQRELPGRPIAIVVPHAGYRYSGPTAGAAFAQLTGREYRRIVLLGPLHRPIWGAALGSYNVPRESAFRTPLGEVPVDREKAHELALHVGLTEVAGDAEHSLEIQLPFLQVAVGAFSLLPIMIADDIADDAGRKRLVRLAEGLAAIRDHETLLVASTDLSHLNSYEDVRRIDAGLVELVGAFDVEGLRSALSRGTIQACGATALVAVLDAARRIGAEQITVLSYTTSGDVTGDRRPGSFTVGYLSAVAHRAS